MISAIHGYSNHEKHKQAAKLQKDVEDFLAGKKALQEQFEAGNAGAAKLKQLAYTRQSEQYPLMTEFKMKYGYGYEKALMALVEGKVNIHHLRRVFQKKVTLNDNTWPAIRDAMKKILSELE